MLSTIRDCFKVMGLRMWFGANFFFFKILMSRYFGVSSDFSLVHGHRIMVTHDLNLLPTVLRHCLWVVSADTT